MLHVVVSAPGIPSSLAVPASVAVFGSVIVWSEPAPAVGAWLAMIVTSLVVESSLSLAVNRRTYVPETLKPAVELSEFAFPNVTVPGPLTFDQVVVRLAGGAGSPSSLAEPARFAWAGNAMV
jgi:hypothetical protein